MNSILDATLGVSIVFAVFALLVSGLQELIAARFNLRGKQLFDALFKLMGRKVVDLLDTPLLQPLDRTVAAKTADGHLQQRPEVVAADRKAVRKTTASYLPSWLFAKAVVASTTMEKIRAAAGAADGAPEHQDLVADVGGPLASVIKSLWTDADADGTKLEASLAKWYDGYMERVSGWYKRNTRWILLVIALLVAGFANVDAIAITKLTISDAPLRAVLVQDASSIKACPAGSSSLTCAQKDLASIPGAQLGLFWQSSCPKVATVATKGRSVTTIVTTNGVAGTPTVTRSATVVPATVSQKCLDHSWFHQHGINNVLDGILKALGLLLGAFAISLGAPFWFDLIGQGLSLRGTGPAPAHDTGAATAPATPPTS